MIRVKIVQVTEIFSQGTILNWENKKDVARFTSQVGFFQDP